MKVGDLLLNWQKKPVAILTCNESNKVFWFQEEKCQKLTTRQMKALFFSEEGLEGANLSGAYLYCADLTDANLEGADLSGVDLRAVVLRGANLRSTNLRDAVLYCADLTDANLEGANLCGAKLEDAIHHRTIWPDGFNKSRLSS